MRGEFNGLKTLILKENEYAYHVHCFLHQLQLALVAVAKNHIQIATLFNLVANIVNVWEPHVNDEIFFGRNKRLELLN